MSKKFFMMMMSSKAVSGGSSALLIDSGTLYDAKINYDWINDGLVSYVHAVDPYCQANLTGGVYEIYRAFYSFDTSTVSGATSASIVINLENNEFYGNSFRILATNYTDPLSSNKPTNFISINRNRTYASGITSNGTYTLTSEAISDMNSSTTFRFVIVTEEDYAENVINTAQGAKVINVPEITYQD